MKINVICATLCLVFVVSCSQDNDLYFDLIGSSSGLIRGVSINNSPDEVKAAEKHTTPILDEDYTLIYHYQYDQGQADINYTFDDRGLYKIELYVRCKTESESKEVLRQFEQEYVHKYGEPKESENSKMWMIDDSSKIIELRKFSKCTDLSIAFEAIE